MMIEYRYIPREGIPMNIHDERKRLAEQAVKTFSRFVEENIEKFGWVLEREEPNRPRIDDIEEMWGELKTRANQIIGELYDGLVKTVPEKEMIAKKNENSANRGWR
jgi:ssDNA-binding replication factor A large subunit